MLVTLLLNLIFTCTARKRNNFCPYGSGTYCIDDLSGYRVCGGDWWSRTKKLIKEVKCPENKRCSCFLGNDCGMVHVGVPIDYVGLEEADICQQYTKAHPLKKVLHLKYRKSGWKNVDPDEDYLYYKENGEIKQDLNAKSLMHTWTNNKKRHFKLIIPDGNGAFIQVGL